MARADLDRRDALLVYKRLRLITEDQLTAGLLFRLSWYGAGKEPSLISAYADFIDREGARESWGERRLRAEKRYNKAARRLAKKGLLDIAISCICRGENVGKGRVVWLRQALDLLGGDGNKRANNHRQRLRGWQG